MKCLIFLISLSFSLVACKKTTSQVGNNSIVGKWKLSETLVDPGNGSGTWHPADSLNPSYLEFKEDGTLIVLPPSANSWDHYQLTSDNSVIFFSGTNKWTWGYNFSPTLLTLYGPCIEACGDRYIPVQ